MGNQSQWVSEDANQSILRGISEIVDQRLAEYDTAREKIREDQARIEQEYADWITDEASKFHLRFMAVLLAAYRVLQDFMPAEEAIAVLKQAAIEPNSKAIREGVKYALDGSPDPMRTLVDASKHREEFFFGQTFSFDRRQDDQQAYILHVRRCFYHQFAHANDALELMQVLCEWDWIWAKAIEPNRHRFSFELPTTLGYGGDVCRFCFRRLSQ